MIEEQEIHQPENYDSDEMIASLEDHLRILIENDPGNFQAKLKLTRLLLNKQAFQEAKFFIMAVENDRNLEDDVRKLEMLGSLYMNMHISKVLFDEDELSIIAPELTKKESDTKDFLGIAMNKFLGAISRDSDSEIAHWGLGMSLS